MATDRSVRILIPRRERISLYIKLHLLSEIKLKNGRYITSGAAHSTLKLAVYEGVCMIELTDPEHSLIFRERVIVMWMKSRVLYGMPFGMTNWHPNGVFSFTFVDGYAIEWMGDSNDKQ